MITIQKQRFTHTNMGMKEQDLSMNSMMNRAMLSGLEHKHGA